MIDQDNRQAPNAEDDAGTPRQRAIEAYDSARERASESLSEAPLIALAGGIAAGALIATLLPKTRTEARLIRPTARRVKDSARAALDAARETGTDRLNELGFNREKGEETIRSLLGGITDAAKASASAAADSIRSKG